jgi:hypothetical protein
LHDALQFTEDKASGKTEWQYILIEDFKGSVDGWLVGTGSNALKESPGTGLPEGVQVSS